MNRSVQTIAAACTAFILITSGVAAEPGRLMVDRERTYVIERSSGEGPRPTIILLHGFNGSGANVARVPAFQQIGPRSGFVAVFPDGLGKGWNHWLPGKALPFYAQHSKEIGGAPDDIGFLKALVADLVWRGISDPKRIYLAGFSNGSFLTLRVICANTGIFAGYGLLAGVMPDLLGAECRPSGPVPVVMVNGTADDVNPYAGGMVKPPNSISVWPSERLASFFRQHNGCQATAEQSVIPNAGPNKVELSRWKNCTGAPVEFYRVIGGGHSVPPNTGQVLLDFFRDKVRPAASQ